MHLVLAICTCGWWLPVWLTVTLLDRRVARLGREPGVRGGLTAHPVVTGIGMFAGLVLVAADRNALVLLASTIAVAAGLIVLTGLAIQTVRGRRQLNAEIAARADDQNEAVLRGDEDWGVFGIKPPAQPALELAPPRKAVRRSLLAGLAVLAGILVVAAMITVDARSADRTPATMPAPTVTVTRPAFTPVPIPRISPPPPAIPLPPVPAPILAPTSTPTQPPAAAVRIGQQAFDGDLTFVVTSVDRSKTFASPIVPFIQTTASGTLLTAYLTITNTGRRPEAFIPSGQKLTINGAVYDADPVLALWTLPLGVSVSPGATVAAELSFDVPTDTPPGGMLALRASPNSRGTIVELLSPQ